MEVPFPLFRPSGVFLREECNKFRASEKFRNRGRKIPTLISPKGGEIRMGHPVMGYPHGPDWMHSNLLACLIV
jgi:hypothetical protein